MHNAGIYVEPYEPNQVRRTCCYTVISGVLIGFHSAHASTHVIKVLELQSLM